MKRFWTLRALAVIAATLLGACGGGGGGGGGGALPSLGTTPTTGGTTGAATSSSPVATTVLLNGRATFDSIPNTTGALSYSAISSKAVRGATVEVVGSDAAVLASATTDANGAYSVSVPSDTPIVVRVKAQMQQTGPGATWDVSIRDNTQSDAIYAMETPAFSSGSAATVQRDVQAPSGWDGMSYTSTRVAGPFALLDTIYTAQAKVLSIAPATIFPPLKVFWSINNVPASGNSALGQIGTTFFSDGVGGRAIFVLGKENVDTDEYDVSVVAHEWGHYYQSSFSRDDSPGGGHSFSDRLDRRVAFSEGWGNAWSGIALGRSNYTDSVGPAQAQGSNLDLTVGPQFNKGWFKEPSIQSILWNLNSQAGFKPIHDTMTGTFKTGIAVTSIHPFTAAFNVAAPSSASVLAGLLSGQNISANPNDPFGMSETNSGGVSLALPMYQSAAVGGSTSACVTSQAGAGNKLGNFVYLRFTAPTARNYSISVAGSQGTDPDFVVYAGGRIAQADSVATSESATVGLPAGEGVLVINDFNNTATCFTATIQ